MPRFAEVTHHEWIAAPAASVRSQFADLHHHVATNVHPKLRFEILESSPQSARYVQEVKLLGIRQRDVFEPTQLGVHSAVQDGVYDARQRGLGVREAVPHVEVKTPSLIGLRLMLLQLAHRRFAPECSRVGRYGQGIAARMTAASGSSPDNRSSYKIQGFLLVRT